MDISIPGYGDLKIENIVLDYNGTLASGGRIIEESVTMLKKLSADYRLFVITADTFGTVERELQGIDCRLHIIGRDNQARQKEEFVETLGADITAAMGNGRNDILMLKRAALGVITSYSIHYTKLYDPRWRRWPVPPGPSPPPLAGKRPPPRRSSSRTVRRPCVEK